MYRGIRYENKITSLIIVHCFLLLLASCFLSCEFHNWYIHAVFIGKEIHCASEKCSSESPEIMVEDTQWSEKAIFYSQSVVDIVAAGITSSININLFNTHARSTVHREEQLLLSNWGGSVSWTTHSGGQTLRCRSKAFREIKWIYIRKSHLWPLIPHHETHQLQCSSLAQMKTHYHHLFRGENVTSSLSFTSGGGFTAAQQ